MKGSRLTRYNSLREERAARSTLTPQEEHQRAMLELGENIGLVTIATAIVMLIGCLLGYHVMPLVVQAIR